MAPDPVEQAVEALKVFPLPGTVLFPRGLLPLNIFEPRFRALVRDALATDGVMAMGSLLPGWQADYQGRPPLRPLVTVASITWHEELPDGRYAILLEGVARARIDAELPPRGLYREVRATLLADPPYHGPEEELLRQAALELAPRLPLEASQPFLEAVAREEGGALADVVASAVTGEESSRLALLEELDVSRRLQAVLGELGGLLARLTGRTAGPVN